MDEQQHHDLASVVANGSRIESLRGLRDRIAADIDTCSSMRDLASLSQRLMDVLKQIDEIDSSAPPARETGLSDFEKRLRERESGAKGSRKAASG